MPLAFPQSVHRGPLRDQHCDKDGPRDNYVALRGLLKESKLRVFSVRNLKKILRKDHVNILEAD